MQKSSRRLGLAVVAITGLGLAASAAHAELIYGITDTATVNLFSFDSASPGAAVVGPAITGLATGQLLAGIDFRPSTGQLYAISTGTTAATVTTGQLYTVNLATGALTPVGTGFTMTGNTSNNISIDFNPVVDGIRVITGSDQNYVVSPVTGATTATDTNVTASRAVVGIAYTNNVAGATSTTLYAYDYVGDIIGTISPPASGTFTAVGASGFVADFASIGFDISGATGVAYLNDTSTTATNDEFRTVNLATGATTVVGQFPSTLFTRDISVQPAVPEPTTLGVLALSGLGLLARRRA